MNQIKKTKSEISVIISSEIRECPFFGFSGGAKTVKKGVQKRAPLYLLFLFQNNYFFACTVFAENLR